MAIWQALGAWLFHDCAIMDDDVNYHLSIYVNFHAKHVS